MIDLRHRGDLDLGRSIRSAGRAGFVDPSREGADGLELAFGLDES